MQQSLFLSFSQCAGQTCRKQTKQWQQFCDFVLTQTFLIFWQFFNELRTGNFSRCNEFYTICVWLCEKEGSSVWFGVSVGTEFVCFGIADFFWRNNGTRQKFFLTLQWWKLAVKKKCSNVWWLTGIVFFFPSFSWKFVACFVCFFIHICLWKFLFTEHYPCFLFILYRLCTHWPDSTVFCIT